MIKKMQILLFCFVCSFLLSQEAVLRTFPDLEHMLDKHFPIELFKNNKGENFSPDFLKGKTSLINFWSTTCGPCIVKIPYLNKISNQLLSSSNFIGITYDSKDKVDAFLKRKPFDFTQITDAGEAINSMFQIVRTPLTFIIDKDGDVKEITPVFEDDDSVVKLLKN